MSLKLLIEEETHSFGTTFKLVREFDGNRERPKVCLSVGSRPIGNPPIYPIVKGTLRNNFSPIGTNQDYGNTYELAVNRAYEIAYSIAKETIEGTTQVLVDNTSRINSPNR